ncbi:uncharacterized protein LOC130736657 [Lotus japonicus]|uniref:uncharacterized protein LOC130736657 n=1 Tax=Lotus japonicus TaxID=34305 RepID=UPI00258AE06A|nr:uncharacterized protein LOC130736657 [Lotus japonicus]
MDDERLALFMEILYALWLTRNELVFNDGNATVEQILKRGSSFHQPHEQQPVGSTMTRNLPAQWSCPRAGIFKENFDAAIQSSGDAGMGLIARDFHGEVLAAACCPLGPVTSPTVVEAMALRWALVMEKDLGFRRVALEMNCLVLFDAWRRVGGFSILDSVVQDCRYLLSCFDVLDFLFVRRSGNQAADALATLSFSLGDVVWIEEIPQQLFGIVQSDVMAFRTLVSS